MRSFFSAPDVAAPFRNDNVPAKCNYNWKCTSANWIEHFARSDSNVPLHREFRVERRESRGESIDLPDKWWMEQNFCKMQPFALFLFFIFLLVSAEEDLANLRSNSILAPRRKQQYHIVLDDFSELLAYIELRQCDLGVGLLLLKCLVCFQFCTSQN